MRHLRGVPRDGFWNIFKAIKSIIISVYDLFLHSYDAITNFCRSTWKISFITELREELTHCKFPLINFITYTAAQVLELFNQDQESLSTKWILRSTFGDLENATMPPLLPKSWTDDDNQTSSEQQIAMSKQAQAIGKHGLATISPKNLVLD